MQYYCRVSGDIDEVNVLKSRCERWIEPTGCSDAHSPASLLKLWFRELHEPLIPDRLYNKCIECCQDAESCISLVHQLPALNRLVFSYLIRFLQVLTVVCFALTRRVYSRSTKMILFGKYLFGLHFMAGNVSTC